MFLSLDIRNLWVRNKEKIDCKCNKICLSRYLLLKGIEDIADAGREEI